MLGDQDGAGRRAGAQWIKGPGAQVFPSAPCRSLACTRTSRTHKFSYTCSTSELMTNKIMHAHFPHTFFSSLYVSDTRVDANIHAVPSLSLHPTKHTTPSADTQHVYLFPHTHTDRHTRPLFTGTVCPVNVRSQQTVFPLISPLDLNKALSLIHCCLGTQ